MPECYNCDVEFLEVFPKESPKSFLCEKCASILRDGSPLDKPVTFWLNFANPDNHLGICLVDANSFLEAVKKAHKLNINPGGEVTGIVIPPKDVKELSPPMEFDVLYQIDDLAAMKIALDQLQE